MKYLFYFTLLLLGLSACDNGDIEAPTFEFEEEITTCDDYKALYLSNADNTEAFILQLSSGDIAADFGVDQIPITATNTNYRIFDSAFTPDYFCTPIPPATPSVLTDWKGVSGSENYIQIETTLALSSSKIGHKHTITLHNLKLEKSDDESILQENFDFGSFTISFNGALDFCDDDDNMTIYMSNTGNTEAFVLQLPSNAIVAEESIIEIPITATNLNYNVYNSSFGNEFFCTTPTSITPSITESWKGVAAEDSYIQIETTLISDTVDSGYKYQITFYNLELETADEESVFVENFDFGSFSIEE